MRYWILAALLLSPTLWADTLAHYRDHRSAYVSGNAVALNLDYNRRDLSPGGVGVRLGGMIDRHWGLELRAAVAPLKDTYRGDNSRYKADYTVDHVGALLATGRYPFSLPFDLPLVESLENRLVENYFVQGFAGVADAKVKTDRRFRCRGGCRQDVERNDETGLAWGLGVGVRSQYNLGLTLQYMHYISTDQIDITSIEGGLEWYF